MDPYLRPLKRFGQNFLIDRNIRKKILECVVSSRDSDVLEIGPGRGALTFSLAERARRLVAVEIDRGLCAFLEKEASGYPRCEIVNADILKFDLKAYVRKRRMRRLAVVANIPYNITTPIIAYLIDRIDLIRDIYLCVQKEVADRLVAAPGSDAYGSLTCFVKYFTEPEILFKIKPGSFAPRPKVDSSFVRLRPRPPGRRICVADEPLFFSVIRTAFGQRRKQLKASLKSAFDKTMIQSLDPSLLARRPETLDLDDFAALANQIFDILKRR